MEQRTDEWHESRRGKFTASEIYKICKPKGLGVGGETYVKQKVGEHFGSFKAEVIAKSLQWGIDNEPIAKEYFKNMTFNEIDEVGFLEYCENSGCSPDGLITGEKIGCEFKCPESPENHISHLLLKNQDDLKKENDQYYWQIQMCLLTTGFDMWYFISFDPRIIGKAKMKILEVLPNYEDQELLKNRLKEAIDLKKEFIQEIKNQLK